MRLRIQKYSLNFALIAYFAVCVLATPSKTNAQQFIESFRFGQQGQDTGQFNDPSAIAVNDDGTLFVVDSRNNRIQLFDLRGKFLKSVGGFGFEPDQFDMPSDIWVKSLLNIYVADYNNRRLQRYDRQMNYLAELVSDPNWSEEYRFGEVLSCALNSQNDLFILDHLENKVIKLNRNGQPERFFGTYESGQGELQEPIQLDILKNQWVIISDISRKAIIIFDFFGTFIRAVNFPQFIHPAGLATDDRLGILIADEGAKSIFRVTPDLQTVFPIKLTLEKPLVAPRDLVIMPSINDDNTFLCFILDDNQVVAGRLVESK